MKHIRIRPLFFTLFVITIIVVTINGFSQHAMPLETSQKVEIWVRLRQLPQAAAALRQEIDRNPGDLDNQYHFLSVVYSMQPQNRNAYHPEDYYDKLGKKAGMADISLWGKGWILNYQKKPDQALETFSQISELDMKYVHLGKAIALQQLNLNSQAALEFQQEIDNNGAFRIAYTDLFALQIRSGQTAAATHLLKQNPEILTMVNLSDLRQFAMLERNASLYLQALLVIPFRSMELFTVFSSLFIAMIWFFYFWRIDIFDQEPVLLGILAVISGIFIAIIAGPVLDFLSLYLKLQTSDSTLQSLFYSIVIVGLPEELLKFIPVLLIIKLTRQVNEPVDLIIYGSLTALGFATFENIMLISQYGMGVMIARLLVATIMHMVSTAVLCFAWAYAHFIRPGKLTGFTFLGWLAAALVHGLFNHFVLAVEPGLSALSLLVLVLSIWGYSLMLRNALNFSPFFTTKQTQSGRLINYEWILVAALWLEAMGYLYVNIVYATSAANSWLLTNIWTAIPIVLGLFAALGELGLNKDAVSFP